MQLTTLLTTALTALTVNAAAISSPPSAEAAEVLESRAGLIGSFGVSLIRACPIQNPWNVNFADGGESPACHAFYNAAGQKTAYTTVSVYHWNPKCLLTLFIKADCSDPGIVSGLGCWQPEGGIRGFKVTCPYK